MNRLSIKEEEDIKNTLLKMLDLSYIRIKRGLYKIDNKIVNVKITKPNIHNRYWFNIQRKTDSYIWICYDPLAHSIEACYWVPAQKMWELVNKSSWIDKTWKERGRLIHTFEIDPKSDSYISKSFKISIRKFRCLKI